MSETTDTYYEYGYRIDGVEVWEVDRGPDGAWIPARPDLAIRAIDVNIGGVDSSEEIQGDLYEELEGTGRFAHVIRRKVTLTRGEVEVLGSSDELSEDELGTSSTGRGTL